MTIRTHNQRLQALLPASQPSSFTTDDIPLPTGATLIHQLPRLTRQATDPVSVVESTIPLPVPPLLSAPPSHDTMASSVTITFSQTGVQPPVYVTSSLSGWTTLEMNVEEDKTASDNLVFSKEFSDVAEGSYQYKIRVGEDNWVLDESKETGTYTWTFPVYLTNNWQRPTTKVSATTSSTSNPPAKPTPRAPRPMPQRYRNRRQTCRP